MPPKTITGTTVVVAVDGLSVADLDGEAVVLAPDTSTYFGLNEVGARALELAQHAQPIQAIVNAILQEYDVSPEQLTADLLRFFEDMEEAHLIKTDETTS